MPPPIVSGSNLLPVAPLTWRNVIPDSAVTSVNLTAGTGMGSRVLISPASGLPLCGVRLNTLEATKVETATAAMKANTKARALRVIELVGLRGKAMKDPRQNDRESRLRSQVTSLQDHVPVRARGRVNDAVAGRVVGGLVAGP